jgi:hypothetical protein
MDTAFPCIRTSVSRARVLLRVGTIWAVMKSATLLYADALECNPIIITDITS